MRQALPYPNVANTIATHISMMWPELTTIPNVWFTGSQIWSFLYDLPEREPLIERDWDIFVIGNAPARRVCDQLHLPTMPACRTQDKHRGAVRTIAAEHVPSLVHSSGSSSSSGYTDGWSYLTPRGILDLWVTRFADVFAEIRDYPTESHAHCRAAYSLTCGLVVLPNELIPNIAEKKQ
jgi:hypothetical protein